MLSRPRSPTDTDAKLIESMISSVIAAGKAILRIRAEGHAVETKADRSPVTAADRAAEAVVLEALGKLAPDWPIVAEEQVAEGRVPTLGSEFVLVDALDGTKDYLRGGPDFTVNVGLVRMGVAVAGIVHAPALGRLWLGVLGEGASVMDIGTGKRTAIHVRTPQDGAFDIVASRSHRTPETDDFIARFPGSRIVAAGSSLKFVTVAEGKADLYPRLGTTSQWDTAAGDAVLTAAGGQVLDLEGRPLSYGPRVGTGPHPFLNPWFVATGGLDPFAAGEGTEDSHLGTPSPSPGSTR